MHKYIVSIIPKMIRMIGIGLVTLGTETQSMEALERKQLSGILAELKAPDSIKNSIEAYRKSLPTIGCSMNASNDDKAAAIVNLLIQMIPQRNKTKEGRFELLGAAELIHKIKYLIEDKKPIEMITIGFPFKSGNHDHKVIDQRIDMGEFFSLITYEHICQEIGTIYESGGRLTLHSDGIVYKKLDLFNCLETYQKDLGILVDLFPSITLAHALSEDIISAQMDGKLDVQTKKDICYFMESELNCTAWKKRMLRQFLISIELISIDHKSNGTVKVVILINDSELEFNVSVRNVDFLTVIINQDIDSFIYQCFDDAFIKIFEKTILKEINQIINSKTSEMKIELADFAAQSSGKFSSAVKKTTPNYDDHIRLSVHPHTRIHEKCGVSPIFGSTCTPWHACPIVGSHGIKVMPKGEFIKYLKPQDHFHYLREITINGIPLKYYEYDLS